MRKAVYLFLLALLLLELVTVEGGCIGSGCSYLAGMSHCGTLCHKCSSTTSCIEAQFACRSVGDVTCVPFTDEGRCEYDCSRCTSIDECQTAVFKCAQYDGITSCTKTTTFLCQYDCSECTSTASCDAVVARCKQYGITSCIPRPSSSSCKYDCSECTSTASCNAVAARCYRYGITSCPQSTSSGMADIFDMDWDETDEIPGVEPIESTNGLIAFKVTKPAIISVAVVIFLLVINISCLCYNKCIKNRKDKKIMYAKVAAVASSDDDMENLKRVEI